MKEVEYPQKKNGKYIWRIISVKGKVSKILAVSGGDYTKKPSAKRAYKNLWGYYHGAPKGGKL